MFVFFFLLYVFCLSMVVHFGAGFVTCIWAGWDMAVKDKLDWMIWVDDGCI